MVQEDPAKCLVILSISTENLSERKRTFFEESCNEGFELYPTLTILEHIIIHSNYPTIFPRGDFNIIPHLMLFASDSNLRTQKVRLILKQILLTRVVLSVPGVELDDSLRIVVRTHIQH